MGDDARRGEQTFSLKGWAVARTVLEVNQLFVNSNCMKLRSFYSLCVGAVVLTATAVVALADDLARLEGKWTAKRKGDQGEVTQVLEITKGKFTFRMKSADGETRLYAEGDVKAEKLGPFTTAKFFNIRGGSSSSDLQAVDDDRVVIYSLEYNKLRVAQGFDKDRDGDEPHVDVYTKN